MIQIPLLITLAVGLLTQWHVKHTYARHSRTPVQSGHPGAEAAREIARQAGLTNVTIFSIEHERDAAVEEPEPQLKWKANGPAGGGDIIPSRTNDLERSKHEKSNQNQEEEQRQCWSARS